MLDEAGCWCVNLCWEAVFTQPGRVGWLLSESVSCASICHAPVLYSSASMCVREGSGCD